jgi:aminopeptidase N
MLGPAAAPAGLMAAEHRFGNGTTEQFIALSERVSGRDLGPFFRIWLYTPAKPTSW